MRIGQRTRRLLIAVLFLLPVFPLLPHINPDPQFWVFIVWIALCAAFWGFLGALAARAYVVRERRKHPRDDYSTAFLSARNHTIAQLVLFLVQLTKIAFGVFQGLQPPVPQDGTTTPVEIAAIVWILSEEGLLIFLSFWLIRQRARLIKNVLKTGGD